ncbi:MAG: type II secretion system protein GspN [Nitrospirae bacterium]|nr:type II secretion system protein GspN [Nitrospirota bacterium]
MESKNPLPVLIRYILLLVIGISLIIIGVWLIVISEDTVREAIRYAIGNNDLRIEIEGLKKGLFYNLKAEKVLFVSKDKDLIFIEDVSLRMNPFYLFLLRHKSSFNGKIKEGIVAGDLAIRGKKIHADIRFNRIDIRDIPYLEVIGFKGNGILDSDIIYEGTRGIIKFTVDNLRLEPFNLSGITLPLEIFDKAGGRVNLESDGIRIESLSLEGKGIYGRLKGSIMNNQADLTLEIMPETSAGDKFPALMLIGNYKVSPGYYVIPIKARIDF